MQPIDEYLLMLRAVGRADNTIRSYARHLSVFFRWLDAYRVTWSAITFEQLCDFAHGEGRLPLPTRDDQPRSRSTVDAVLSAVTEFLHYHQLEGTVPASLRLREDLSGPGAGRHSFLGHIAARRPESRRRLRSRRPQSPETIGSWVTASTRRS